MKLDDSAIAQIAKVLQVAILTGTDIVDNLRQINFVAEGDALFMDPAYEDSFEKNLQKMLDNVKLNEALEQVQ
tara:strand:+ start:1487 stop:1705 length:219 start_codon:yes stop_codon:yes gene_type:complete